jgi:hypothetical protein
MTFIQLENGALVNPDDVGAIDPIWRSEHGTQQKRWRLLDHRGDLIGIAHWCFNPNDLAAHVLRQYDTVVAVLTASTEDVLAALSAHLGDDTMTSSP